MSSLSSTTPVLSPTSKLVTGSKTPNVLSPTTPSGTGKSKRRRDRDARKNSQHYQESHILESYYRSSPADKISDYEDIWNTTDQSNHSTWSPKEMLQMKGGNELLGINDRLIIRNEKLTYKEVSSPEFTSFKPVLDQKTPDPSVEETGQGKKPDLLSRVCKLCWSVKKLPEICPCSCG